MIEGALIALAGVILGRLLPNRRRDPKQPEPMCGCKHHLSLHDPVTNVCHGTGKEPVKWDAYGTPRAWQYPPCTCRQYVGPMSIETFFAPRMLPPGDS
jgi:hypothetical protein